MIDSKLRRYSDAALVYSILAMVGGVFFREFTKFNSYTGETLLSVIHTHYFVLGVAGSLLLLLLRKNFSFEERKLWNHEIVFHIGLNATVFMMLVRGILQVLEIPLGKGPNAAISGIAGLGHIALGVSIILIMLDIGKAVSRS